MPNHPFVSVSARSGVGRAATEAPRGMLYHRYTIDGSGNIVDATIIPPTSQNLKTIEHDLRQIVTENIELPKDELTARCELTVRNYDPCISCSTHYLRLEYEYE
jgi:coenzyme F420-reducing hydrogenase alpha subunit